MSVTCRTKCAIALLLMMGSFLIYANSLNRLTLSVDGIQREALIYLPDDKSDILRPVIFAFHGHGGTMRLAAEKFSCENYWPEAIVIYPQGLKTPGTLTDPRGMQSGWQNSIGDMADRDIRFFDELLQYLNHAYTIDQTRIYALGHSNGGLMTYILWAARGDVLAGIASISAILGSAKDRALLTPKPVFYVAGRNDPLVKYEWQVHMIEYIKKVNGCGNGEQGETEGITIYPSLRGTPLVTYIHNGGHEVPEGIMADIIGFFKSCSLHEQLF